jgi:hypothetical protein
MIRRGRAHEEHRDGGEASDKDARQMPSPHIRSSFGLQGHPEQPPVKRLYLGG